MSWLDRLDQIATGLAVLIAGFILTGLGWMVRTFFTDRARIDALEKGMKQAQDDQKSYRNDIKSDMAEWREEVRHGFDKFDGKLDDIQKELRK